MSVSVLSFPNGVPGNQIRILLFKEAVQSFLPQGHIGLNELTVGSLNFGTNGFVGLQHQIGAALACLNSGITDDGLILFGQCLKVCLVHDERVGIVNVFGFDDVLGTLVPAQAGDVGQAVLSAMFPVLKNTYTGLLGVEQKYLEAAKGCGMSQLQSLLRVELPLAMPSIIAGLRMSAIYTVSWAVLAAMIGLGGLGGFVYQGTSSNNNTLILLGAIPSALLAVVIGVLVDLLQKRVAPQGLRKEGS